MSTALPITWSQRLADLGNIPPERIRDTPAPGTGRVEDVTRLKDTEGRLYELIDGTLVEKAMGWQESLLAGVLLQWLNNFLDDNPIGLATAPDGMTRLFGDTVRGPDVAFVSWDRLPDGVPRDPIPALVPNFVVEVLSVSNTYSEMSRKRREYFQAGVELLWMVHPRERTVTVFTGANEAVVLKEGETVGGGTVLPGWSIDSGSLFAKLDQARPQS